MLLQKYWLKVSINDDAWMDTDPPDGEYEEDKPYYLASDVDARIAVLEQALRELTYRSPVTGQVITVKCDATKIMRELGLTS